MKRVKAVEDLNICIIGAQGIVGVGAIIRTPTASCRAAASHVNSHPTPTPLSRPKMTPYRRANVPSEGAETGGAEAPIAEQSRSWRAASGGLGD